MLICFLFFLIVVVLFINFNRLLLSLLVLEILSFVVLLSAYVYTCSLAVTHMLVIIFCVFVLESVVSIVYFLNFLNFFGTDFLKGVSFSGM